jgi:hypothetical protein
LVRGLAAVGSVFVVGGSCDPASVEPGLSVLLPQDVEIAWDAAFEATGDARVAVVPLDVMVYEAATGDPVGDVEVTLVARGAALAAEGSFAEAGPGVVGGASGDSGGGRAPGAVWDTWSGQWVVPQSALSPRLVARSDSAGLVHFSVVVDALFGPVEVEVAASDRGAPPRAPARFRLSGQK